MLKKCHTLGFKEPSEVQCLVGALVGMRELGISASSLRKQLPALLLHSWQAWPGRAHAFLVL